MAFTPKTPNQGEEAGTGPIKRFLFVGGKKQKPGRSKLSVGTLVYEVTLPKIERKGNGEICVQIMPYDIENGEKNEGILYHESCLRKLKDDELDIFSAIRRSERRLTLIDENFDTNHLSVTERPVTVIHPLDENEVVGKVVCETTRPDRMGTWWHMELEEVIYSS